MPKILTLLRVSPRCFVCLASLHGVDFWWTTRDDAKAFLKLLSLGRISLDGFVSETHSPVECAEVYRRLAAGGPFPAVQFDWTRIDG